ncbi:MAG TPA: GIY-YIG nuclease family protein [Bacteroidales bacterium]|nr:GIY-YIG nuclease family protein [Bacteroidales bacterium]
MIGGFFLFHMCYIYILFSEKAGKYYVGQSKNPFNRLEQHNDPKNLTFTSKFADWKLKAVFSASESKRSVASLEKYIKKQKSKLLIEKLIDPEFSPDGELAGLIRIPLPDR